MSIFRPKGGQPSEAKPFTSPSWSRCTSFLGGISLTLEALAVDGGKRKQHLKPGDFALIPAFAEHQEVNESDEVSKSRMREERGEGLMGKGEFADKVMQDVVWCIVRSGEAPIVVNLPEGWGSS